MKNEAIRLAPLLIQLQETDGQSSAPKRVELLKAGRYEYEGFFSRSLLTIDKTLFDSLKKNFDASIRKTKLAVDYGHDNGGPAAGWVEGVELAEDGSAFFILVDWTPEGKRALADREYCYISAEFHQNYRDNETGKLHGPTLFGAGLTNRPFIKGMKPVELSDDARKGETMTQEEIKALEDRAAAAEKKNQELEASNKALAEKAEADRKAKALSDKEAAFEKMVLEKKAVPAQKEAFMSDDVAKFAELAQPLKLEEQGHGRSDAGADQLSDGKSATPAQDQVLKLARKKSSDEEISLGDAISAVLDEHADLHKKYLAETAV